MPPSNVIDSHARGEDHGFQMHPLLPEQRETGKGREGELTGRTAGDEEVVRTLVVIHDDGWAAHSLDHHLTRSLPEVTLPERTICLTGAVSASLGWGRSKHKASQSDSRHPSEWQQAIGTMFSGCFTNENKRVIH